MRDSEVAYRDSITNHKKLKIFQLMFIINRIICIKKFLPVGHVGLHTCSGCIPICHETTVQQLCLNCNVVQRRQLTKRFRNRIH